MVKHNWTQEESKTWREKHRVKRSYQEDVISSIDKLAKFFDKTQYGTLEYSEGVYPLFYL